MDLRFERLKFITAVVLYGTIGMILRAVNLPSEVVAMARGCIGSIFIILFMKMRHIPLNTRSIRRNFRLLLISGILLGLNWVFLFAAYNVTTVAIAILCTYMAPLIVILVTPAALQASSFFLAMLVSLNGRIPPNTNQDSSNSSKAE